MILERGAVGDHLQRIVNCPDFRSADEGRLSSVTQDGRNKIGGKIVDSRVTLHRDPADSQLLAPPLDGDRSPLARRSWIDNGVLNSLYYVRFLARKQGKVSFGALSSFKVIGGSASIEEVIEITKRGILATRRWYLREIDLRTILYTRLTRDGPVLIANGRITKSIRNVRFNESPLFIMISRCSDAPNISPEPNNAAMR